MNQDEKLLNGLKQAVLDNLENEQFSVEQLSQIAGLSRSHLHRKLKKLKGQSISQFIREVKLEEALKLLHQDVATTSEIAYRVGFNSPSYFHKCFLEYYGYPPSEAKGMTQIPSESKAGDNKSDHQSAITSNISIPPAPASKDKVTQGSFWSRSFVLSIIAVLILISAAAYYWSNNRSSRPLEKSIAVLPFNNLSADEANQHFADGLVEDLLSRLATVKEFKVISRTSSDTYRKRGTKKIPEIASELGVSYIVEGSIQREGNKARITVQLIDAKEDKHIWIKTFDRGVADVFKIQSEIAIQVASGLSAALSEQETEDLQKNRTDIVKAFELYQLGRHHWGKRTFEGLKTSITYFEQAIAEDSTYALAYAGMADTYYLMCLFDHVDHRKRNREKALILAQKALELDNQLTEAFTVTATVNSFVDWNWETAEKAFLQGLELNSNYSNIHHRYSEHLSVTGRHKEARQHINKALELDPLSFIVRYVSAKLYYNRGLFKEALAEIQICNDLMMNKFHWFTHDMNFELSYHAGNALALLKNLNVVEDKYGISKPKNIDSIYTASGSKGLVRYRAELDSEPFYKARFYGVSGDDEKAIDWLEIAFEDKKSEVDMPYMYNFRNLHSNPRFHKLLNKMNLPWEPDPSQ